MSKTADNRQQKPPNVTIDIRNELKLGTNHTPAVFTLVLKISNLVENLKRNRISVS